MNFSINSAVNYVKYVIKELLKRINCRRYAGGSTSNEVSKIGYTTEQLEAVWRIERCKDYYEMLGVTKQATVSVVKRAYRKLALQLHPDKNKAPGSEEAFKTIGNAMAILIDVRKRVLY